MSNDINYVRKKFSVQAQRVNPLNIRQLAKWCGGKVMDDGEKEGNFSREYIKVKVQNAKEEDHTKAKVGDWIVKSGRIWKVYNDKAFRRTFERADGTPVESDDAPVIRKAPVPTPPRQKQPVNQVQADQAEFARQQEALVGENGPNVTNLGSNVEIPNEDGSITVVPTPDPAVIAAQNAKQVDPIPEVVKPDSELTVDEQLAREGKVGAIVEGEIAQASQLPTIQESSDKITDLTLNNASPEELQAAIDESIEVIDAAKQPPVMTEVAPGVEISDGPVVLQAGGELVDAPQDVVVPDEIDDPDGLNVEGSEQTPGERFRGEA